MREINMIVVHCSATKEKRWYDADDIRSWHLNRGFRDIGYHMIVRLDGSLEAGRKITEMGAHAKGYNTNSIGICYIGGLDKEGKAKDTRTPEQKKSLDRLIHSLRIAFGKLKVVGHRDLSVDLNGDGVISKDEWMKECPCFNAKEEYNG